MAAKKKAHKRANNDESTNNGNTPLWRLKGEERDEGIFQRYPEMVKPIDALANAFEVVAPPDARVVSGFLRSRIASFSETRRGEHDAFRKEQKLKRLEGKEAEHRKALDELDALRVELA